MIVAVFFTLLAISSEWQIASAADNNPGLDFVPRPDPAHLQDTLIYYKTRDQASMLKWTSKIDEFLIPYKKVTPASRQVYWLNCSPDTPPFGDGVCDVSVREFEPCIAENNYGYHRGTPCVFLKLDKIIDWTPNPYNTSEGLPTDMPNDLKQHISEHSGQEEANRVWVSCEGENPADVEFMGPIKYIPSRGFPSYYFPVTNGNKEGYVSPLVAIHFERPIYGIVINIECKAWAKNIVRDQYEKRGSVHFELMVDP